MKRSKFSLSHGKLCSMNMGFAVPMACVEVLPGDSIRKASSIFMRVQPLLTPVMHPVHVQQIDVFVPSRLLWDSWEDFITGGLDGEDDSEFPTIVAPSEGGFAVGSLADHLGIPTGIANLEVSALQFRAYAKWYNDWVRDEQLMPAVALSTADGVDSITNTTLLNAAWEKDYLTSARPEPQLGPDVVIPLGTTAPVTITSNDEEVRLRVTGSSTDRSWNVNVGGSTDNNPMMAGGAVPGGQVGVRFGSVSGLVGEADLEDATSISVRAFREALAEQRFEEMQNRWGARYTEYLRSLGVRPSDARLQRSEILGSSRGYIQFSEVLQTAEGEDPVGTMRGHGISGMRTRRWLKFFEEHGYMLSILIIRPKTMYFQGLHRQWNRRTKYDFWQRQFEHVGAQAVLNKEVYAAHAQPEETFGWQDRYDDLRRLESFVSGEMRTVLKDWHMAREFETTPALNSTFVTCVPTDRIYASTATDELVVMCNHSIQARRLLSSSARPFTE